MASGRLTRVLILLLLVLTLLPPAPVRGASALNDHPVVLDDSGKLLSWISPQADAYDRTMALAWSFLLTGAPSGPSGLKIYFSHSYADPNTLAPATWPHNPAGAYAMLVESALAYYAYSGNEAVLDFARQLLDHELAHGMTPAGWAWANVPYASGDAGSTEYRGARMGDADGRGDGVGVIEPDKVGELGNAYLRFYELTGDVRYRDAAISAADALARHIRPGDASRSPWPFRVFAQTGTAREEYTAHLIGPIRLLDELIRVNLGDIAQYQAARQTAWTWVMSHPMRTNAWANYFEDVPVQADLSNLNQLAALETARYILQNPDVDPDWQLHVPGLIGWVEQTFAQDQHGANAIAEQVVFRHVMGSHTARYASVNALWYERTGDTVAKEKAFRSFNWATYMAKPDGRVIDGPDVNQIWWTDGYGDYIRHFMAGFGSVPEWSPPQQNHGVRFSAQLKRIVYAPSEILYETTGGGTDVLRLSFTPTRVSVDGQELAERANLADNGWTFDRQFGVLRISHLDPGQIRISGPVIIATSTPPPSLPAPGAVDTGGIAVSPPEVAAPVVSGATSSDGGHFETVSFDDRTGENQILNGQYPEGVIDWGGQTWWHSGPWRGMTTKSVSFNGAGITQAALRFVTPRRLIRLDVFNGGPAPSTVTLSCAGQTDKVATLLPDQQITIDTGWSGLCSTVTIASTNGWDTNFDNLVLATS
jgi:hypothetical protein